MPPGNLFRLMCQTRPEGLRGWSRPPNGCSDGHLEFIRRHLEPPSRMESSANAGPVVMRRWREPAQGRMLSPTRERAEPRRRRATPAPQSRRWRSGELLLGFSERPIDHQTSPVLYAHRRRSGRPSQWVRRDECTGAPSLFLDCSMALSDQTQHFFRGPFHLRFIGIDEKHVSQVILHGSARAIRKDCPSAKRRSGKAPLRRPSDCPPPL
jgi:hypothetical protein